MGNKKEKFYEQLCEITESCENEINLLQKVFEGNLNVFDAFAPISESKQNINILMPKINRRAIKICKISDEGFLVYRLVDKIYTASVLIDEIFLQIQTFPQEECPRNLEVVLNLIRCSFGELVKILQYTENIDDSYMKAEARIRKIFEYKKRGDACYSDLLKSLYTMEDRPLYVIRWREIIGKLKNILDECIESAIILRTLL
ncbi:hypothetical protein [Dialister micraerophilus]|uniref:hypothetical protein n=1 Tax=Dialister micraerophilus TaxID=309120 RepID=UPI0023F3793D|nr:hypothetical protein [Dialister micraerophilus]